MSDSRTTNASEVCCPRCGSHDVAQLVFGHPTPGLREAYEGQNVAFGGCMAWRDERDPQSACRGCGLWFGALVQLPVPWMYLGGEERSDICVGCGSAASWIERRVPDALDPQRAEIGRWLGCDRCEREWPEDDPGWGLTPDLREVRSDRSGVLPFRRSRG